MFNRVKFDDAVWPASPTGLTLPELPDEVDPADAAWWRDLVTGLVLGSLMLTAVLMLLA